MQEEGRVTDEMNVSLRDKVVMLEKQLQASDMNCTALVDQLKKQGAVM